MSYLARPRSRVSKFGVKRIVRDSYRGNDWYDIIGRVHERDGPNCTQCGKYLGKRVGEVHHIVPLSRGGTTTLANLRKLCTDCHDGKHSHLSKRRS